MEPLRVLVVDDDYAVLELFVAYLRGRGLDVRGAEGVEAARDVLDAGVDVLVTELALPDGDGVELLREARLRGVASLVATAPGASEDIVQAFREGAGDVLLKPFRLRTLHDAVMAARTRTESRRAAARDRATRAWLERAVTVEDAAAVDGLGRMLVAMAREHFGVALRLEGASVGGLEGHEVLRPYARAWAQVCARVGR